MKTIIFILSIVLLISCSVESYTPPKEASRTNLNLKIDNREFEIFTIDSCEYIGSYMNNNGAVLTHKGNCKFCKIRTHE